MNEIIEIFLERGHITKEAAERLEDFEQMTKEALGWKEFGDKTLDFALGIGTAVGGYKLIKMLDKHNKASAHHEQAAQFHADAQKSLNILKETDPMFKEHPEKAIERFREIVAIAPVLAANPTLSSKIVKKFLHTGIDYEGVQGLSSLQESRAQYADLTKPEGYAEDLKEAYKDSVKASLRYAKKGIVPFVNARAAEGNAAYEQEKQAIEAKYASEKTAAYLGDLYPLVKEATFQEALMDVLKRVGVGAGIGVGVIGANKVVDAYQQHKLKGKLEASWDMTLNKLKAMTSTGGRYAQGQDYHSREVQEQAREAFHTLATISPALAVNPVTASTFVNRAVQNESQIDPELLKTISEIQKNVSQAGKREDGPFTKALDIGQKFAPSATRKNFPDSTSDYGEHVPGGTEVTWKS